MHRLISSRNWLLLRLLKHCNEYVCLSVCLYACLSVCLYLPLHITLNHTAELHQFYLCFPVAMARSSYDGVAVC